MITNSTINSVQILCTTQVPPRTYAISDFLTIGSESSSHIVLSGPQVADRHARIEQRGALFILKDMRSPSGTRLNGVPILEAILNVGDTIELGSHLLLVQDCNRLPQKDPILDTKNPAWSANIQRLPSFAKSDLSVLLLGSSGSGKDRIARAIHDNSKRKSAPFIAVNCSALSESLLESELFGHVRGSFTGATHDRRGAFESARRGTLFLDEVGDLPLHLQPKLLRALENCEIRPVGSDRVIQTDVRIIAATHQNLPQKIVEGSFRSDLFFRLNVVRVDVPDLAERLEDFDSLLFQFARQMRVRFSQQAIELMKKHDWPGNIRELKNSVARASALYTGESITPAHVPSLIDSIKPAKIFQSVSPDVSQPTHGSIIRDIERDLIVRRLVANRGNQRRTAQELGLPKSTLHDRINSYGINLQAIVRGEPILS